MNPKKWSFNTWLIVGTIILSALVLVGIGIATSLQTNTLPDGHYHLTCTQNGLTVLDVETYGQAPVKTGMRMGTTMWSMKWYDQAGNPQYFPFTGDLACRPEPIGQ